MKEDIIKIAARFNDIFPQAELTLGGSMALAIHNPERDVQPKDIDLYIKLAITRTGFREVLESIVFKDEDIMFEGKEYDRVPAHGHYRMPCIIRRVKVLRYDAPDVDFIFTNTMHTVPQWLVKNQASTLTEVCYRLDTFDDCHKLTQASCTDDFRLVVGGYQPVKLQLDPKVCSPEHARRIVDRCKRMDLEVRKV